MNRKSVEGPWGGGNHFVRAICEHGEENGFKVVHQFGEDLDAILMIDPRRDELGIDVQRIWSYKQQHPKTKLIHRINECDARKNTTDMDDLLQRCSDISDATVFVSHWIKQYFNTHPTGRSWGCSNQHVVYNGTNHDWFKPGEKFKDGRTHLVTAHWSNNYMKGFDIYDALDKWVKENDDFTFTYIGRERGTFKNTRVIAPLFGEELGKELGRYDIYISASRHDPGPNSIIESMACGLPTFAHRDGGGAMEFVGLGGIGYVFGDMAELIAHLKNHQIREDSFEPQYMKWDQTWGKCAKEYFDLLLESSI